MKLEKLDYISETSEGLRAVRKGYKWGYINADNKKVINFKYLFASSFKDGIAIVQDKNSKFGCINNKGKVIIDFKYDSVKEFSEGLAQVRKNLSWGFIDAKGNEIVPLKYGRAYGFRNGFACVMKNGLYGFVNKEGKQVVECIYDDADLGFYDGLTAVKYGDKWGYIDTTGKQITDFKFRLAHRFENGRAEVKINDNYATINTKGEFVINPLPEKHFKGLSKFIDKAIAKKAEDKDLSL